MMFGCGLWSGRYRQGKGVREVHKAVTQKDEAQNTRQLKMESKKNTNITQTFVWARMYCNHNTIKDAKNLNGHQCL